MHLWGAEHCGKYLWGLNCGEISCVFIELVNNHPEKCKELFKSVCLKFKTTQIEQRGPAKGASKVGEGSSISAVQQIENKKRID